MLDVQVTYTDTHRAGRTPEQTAAAHATDKSAHKELNALRALPHNAACADCTAPKPGWAALPHGVFVCIDCAQVHRSLGRHISQTKAINTGTYLWLPHEIAVMREVGNAIAGKAWASAPPKPSRDADPATKLAYAKAKYDSTAWGPDWTGAVKTASAAGASATATATAAAPRAPPVRRRADAVSKSGLAGARRTPTEAAAPPFGQCGDLIDLSDPVDSPAADGCAATAPGPWAGAAPPPLKPLALAGGEAWEAKVYEAKVAKVIAVAASLAGPTPHAQPHRPAATAQSALVAPNQSAELFFADFGL